ncbi:MAG: uracil-DNA glycosylase [Aquabacterium sp.]
MRWTERQRAMLREMGIPSFWPEEPAPVQMPVADAAVQPDVRLAAPTMDAAVVPVQPAAGMLPAEAARPAAVARPASRPVQPAAASAAAPAVGVRPPPAPEMAGLGPRPEGVDRMDWPALREAVADCRACGLCHSRTQTVFGVGNPQAEWMVIGEAPGEQEDRQGEPFVGRAGQLLDRMLQAVGRTRSEAPPPEQVFIANVLKCRPPANRNPQPQEVAQCESFLLRQIELVRPKVIVAMGRFAVQSLLKSSEPIGRLRGRVHEVGGVPVIVTYHPAYLLRSPGDKGLAWDDLCLAREVWQRAAPRV